MNTPYVTLFHLSYHHHNLLLPPPPPPPSITTTTTSSTLQRLHNHQRRLSLLHHHPHTSTTITPPPHHNYQDPARAVFPATMVSYNSGHKETHSSPAPPYSPIFSNSNQDRNSSNSLYKHESK
ncbi:uncharacterized protein LOC110896216 [Helianthus annuus]|uniref:uncharacterized protein LOC110896216 n=1 Tax=Helianthus annuus TaxID=4232 RepID=UPI000B8FB990|nr:uncharacterized protein LOC110896216 [Helianthus annuus]